MKMKYSKMISWAGLLLLSAFSGPVAFAKLSVVTTTTDLGYLAKTVAGDDASVDTIAKGTQDPHFIEAKPSFMVKASKADLIIATGLDLEIGWLPSILQGSRNPKIQSGSKGYLEVGSTVDRLEVPSGKLSRSEGDVHPFGNPHVTLDPIRAGQIVVAIAGRMGELDSAHAAQYQSRAKALQSKLEQKTKEWQARITRSGVKAAVTYHKTLTYFLDRFKVANPAILEPKPGIPPTSGHIIEVIRSIREKKIPLVLVENYFDPTVTNKIKQEVPAIRVDVVPVAVGGAPGIDSLETLYERLVKAIEGSAKEGK
jgi:zinc/manganese transport system substrate-binding protein